MADSFLGEIRLLPYTYPPLGWAACSGTTFSIQQNTALFALLGTNFGGNGTTTFNVPNLQGFAVLGASAGAPAREDRFFAETYGAAQVPLTQQEMPAHTHDVTLGKQAAAVNTPSNTTYLSQSLHVGTPFSGIYEVYSATADTTLTAMLQPLGGNLPHDNMQPCLALNYCISLEGEFPSFP